VVGRVVGCVGAGLMSGLLPSAVHKRWQKVAAAPLPVSVAVDGRMQQKTAGNYGAAVGRCWYVWHWQVVSTSNHH
jgi:hypothetical protein